MENLTHHAVATSINSVLQVVGNRRHRRSLIHSPALTEPEQAMVLSQGCPLSAEPFVCVPTSRETRFECAIFRVLLLRRLQLPLHLSARVCRCGRLSDVLGHHRSACATTGVLGRRGFAVDSAAARICREGGGRVRTNVLVRDLDLGVMNHLDGRRIEVIADGLPLFGGVQLAVDTTLVSVLHETACPAEVRISMQVWHCGKHAPAKSAHTLNSRERAGGVRWRSGEQVVAETQDFLCALAEAKARSAPLLLQSKVRSAWLRRWRRILACTRCSTPVPQQEWMGTRPQRSKCCATAATTLSGQREGPAAWICVH